MKAFASCCALALAACLLAACAILPGTAQPTWEELLAEVNAEHQSIRRGEIDPTPYLRTSITEEEGLKVWDYVRAQGEDFDPDRQLTRAEAEEDVAWLFDALYYSYAFYDYLGGPAVFDAAESAVLQELEGKDSLTARELQDLLIGHLGFIKDGHFNINGVQTACRKAPFFFRQVAFVPTEDGWRTVGGRTVESVDGHEDLDELFKRSISRQGDLVYYPVLLEDVAFDMQSEFQQHACSEKLTVRYADGSSQTLTAEPWSVYVSDLPDGERTELRQAGGVPVFQFNNFVSTWRRALMDGANALADAPAGILDLRSNTGGMEDMADSWLLRYSGQTVPSNGLRSFVINGQTAGLAGYTVPDGWVENDRVLIVLTGKRTASCAEIFLERTANLENVLVIGENTSGAMMSNACRMQLPRSGCQVTMTVDSVHQPSADSRYEELRGYEPDIWVPAAEAEELAVKLMERLGASAAPQGQP